jgi:hypothetical protein
MQLERYMANEPKDQEKDIAAEEAKEEHARGKGSGADATVPEEKETKTTTETDVELEDRFQATDN